MTNTADIQLAQRALTAFESCDERAVDELIHPAYRDHASSNSGGRDGARETMQWLRATFADMRMDPEDLIAGGDRVVARVRFSARQIGDLHGIPATGRRLETDHMHIWRVADGQLAEHWMVRDDVTAMEQLGALPAPR
jgi:predicted ester cyclase